MNWNRKEAVAGRFYPSEKDKLENMLSSFCANKSETGKKNVWAIVAPHAGYIYSGRFAGEVYGRIKVPDQVIILCPNHTGRGRKISVWSEGVWSTPLGPVEVDKDLCSKFIEALPGAEPDREAHLQEHAIEVQLPFLRWLNPHVKICPVTLGPLTYPACQQVGNAISRVLNARSGPDILVVASTDMSHYISAAEARGLDTLALDQLRKISGESLYRTIVENDISMCGFIPTTAVLEAARLSEVTHAEVLSYGNSGEQTKDFDSVVGYASAWLFRGNAKA